MATITTINASDQITNSRTVINTNFTNLNSDKIETSYLDTDTALAANSDVKIPSQKAIKAYVDSLLSFGASKSGVSAGPASSSTQTITHGFGRIPVVIRLTALGGFIASGSASNPGMSHGTYNSSGNRCVYIAAGSSGGSLLSATSSTFAIRVSYDGSGGGSAETISATGIVGNVTSTQFDIVWTSTGDMSSAGHFVWEVN